MPDSGSFTFVVEEQDAGERLDTFLASRLSGISRTTAGDLIRSGNVRIFDSVKKPGYRVKTGEVLSARIPPPEPVSAKPEYIKLDVLYDDPHLVVINKPPGLVVHPAPGHLSGTLVNGLLYHFPAVEGIGASLRPGIVHRLDKDTSGTLVVAKQASVHRHLADQFRLRQVKKTYLALVRGKMETASGSISLPIGRHPIHRKMMSTVSRKCRSAETEWRVREKFDGIALLELILKTGRTHQIRVHCHAINHPVIGDPVYCRRRPELNRLPLPRQMLHAWRLGFTHPVTDRWMRFESPVPNDMADLIRLLRTAAGNDQETGASSGSLS